ncbi:uncharacterized protein TNCV_1910771 [Trichonephila clavipes]|nr:uncharacterized protein TNCV_1910771 [Trichonephila clavipes]
MFTIRTMHQRSTSEIQRQVIGTGIVRISSCVGHSTADGRRFVGRFHQIHCVDDASRNHEVKCLNGDRYRAIIANFFIPELNNHDVQELWFQQDGATCHTARATIDLLKDTFGDRLISRFGPVNWPPRSCDLTLLDYFLLGYVKSSVYADKPQTLDHLEDNIRRVIADIRPQMLEKVIENWTSRSDYIRASCGSHTPQIIFKMYCHKIIFRIKKIHVNRIIHRCFIAI